VSDYSASSGGVFRQGDILPDYHQHSVLRRRMHLLCHLQAVHCITNNRYSCSPVIIIIIIIIN